MSHVPLYYIYGNSAAIAAVTPPDPKYFGFERVHNQEIYMLWRKKRHLDGPSDVAALHQQALRYCGPKTEVVEMKQFVHPHPVAAIDPFTGYLNFNIDQRDGYRHLAFETVSKVEFAIAYNDGLTGAARKLPISDVFILGETNQNRKIERMFKRWVKELGKLNNLHLDTICREIGERNNVFLRTMSDKVINLKTFETLKERRAVQGNIECLLGDRKVVMTAKSCKAPATANRLDLLCTLINK